MVRDLADQTKVTKFVLIILDEDVFGLRMKRGGPTMRARNTAKGNRRTTIRENENERERERDKSCKVGYKQTNGKLWWNHSV